MFIKQETYLLKSFILLYLACSVHFIYSNAKVTMVIDETCLLILAQRLQWHAIRSNCIDFKVGLLVF